jgi:hypothetical protein
MLDVDGTINRFHRFAGVSPEMTEGLCGCACLPAELLKGSFLKVTDRDMEGILSKKEKLVSSWE